MVGVSIKKIVLDQSKENAFLITNFSNNRSDEFYIKLITQSAAYEANVLIDDLDGMAKAIRMSLDDFRANTLKALTSDDVHYIYMLTDDPQLGKIFKWKKCVPLESIKISLGSVQLCLVDRDVTLNNILSSASEELSLLQAKINELSTVQERLRRERQNALKCLENNVKEKQKMEQELYSKFCLVLNAKKDEIRRLRTQIPEPENKGKRTDNVSQPGTSATQNLTISSSDGCASDSGAESEHETKVWPSDKCSLGADSSLLLLDDDQLGMNLPYRPRRIHCEEVDDRDEQLPQSSSSGVRVEHPSKYSKRKNSGKQKQPHKQVFPDEASEELIDAL